MADSFKSKPERPGTTRRAALGFVIGAPLLGACSGVQQSLIGSSTQPTPAAPPQQGVTIGTGQVKVALVLPLSASGNASIAAQSMKAPKSSSVRCLQRPFRRPRRRRGRAAFR
jgi:hypothetical protein